MQSVQPERACSLTASKTLETFSEHIWDRRFQVHDENYPDQTAKRIKNAYHRRGNWSLFRCPDWMDYHKKLSLAVRKIAKMDGFSLTNTRPRHRRSAELLNGYLLDIGRQLHQRRSGRYLSRFGIKRSCRFLRSVHKTQGIKASDFLYVRIAGRNKKIPRVRRISLSLEANSAVSKLPCLLRCLQSQPAVQSLKMRLFAGTITHPDTIILYLNNQHAQVVSALVEELTRCFPEKDRLACSIPGMTQLCSGVHTCEERRRGRSGLISRALAEALKHNFHSGREAYRQSVYDYLYLTGINPEFPDFFLPDEHNQHCYALALPAPEPAQSS